jgi:hypothetical protein
MTMSLTDEQLRARLMATPAPVFDVELERASVHARATRRHRRRYTASVVCIVLAFGAVGAGIARLADNGSESPPRSVIAEPAPAPSDPPTTTSIPIAPPTTPLPAGVEQLPASAVADFVLPPGSGSALAVGGGAVWVGGAGSSGPCHTDCGSVARIDPDSGSVVATISVAKFPRSLAYGFDELWMEAEVPDGSPAVVVAIDPTTNQVVAQTDVPGTSIMGSTGHPRIATGAGAVWLQDGAKLFKIDPASGAVVAQATIDTWGPSGVVANDRGVWIVGSGGGVVSVDPDSLETHQLADLPTGYIQSDTLDGDSIWLTEAHTREPGTLPVLELVEVDTTTGQVTFTGIPTTNVSAGGGRVWFQGFSALQASDTQPDYAVEIDPGSRQMLRAATIDLQGISQPFLAVDASDVWVLDLTRLIRVRA